MSAKPKVATDDPDFKLRDQVIMQLDWEPQINAKEIGVSAEDGVISLTGYVDTYPEKMAAEKAAKRVYGTRAVANDIQVKPAYKRVDPDIAKDALHAMQANVKVPDEQINLSVKNGFIYLEGGVDWNYQKRAAESAVKYLNGVKGVINHIDVKPNGTTEQIKENIENALSRLAEIDARRIKVIVREGVVSLFGNVRSWSGRQEVERMAWAAPGVSVVENHINVT